MAVALGKLGGLRARNALAKQLADERYEPARRAEARALVALGDRRTMTLVAALSWAWRPRFLTACAS